MRTMIFPMLLILLCSPLWALDLNGVETRGDLTFNWLMNQKPSAVKDQSAFETPIGYLGAGLHFSPRLAGQFEISYGRIRDPQMGQFSLLMEKAYLSYEVREGLFAEIGLIGNSWVEMMERENPRSWTISKFLQSSLMRLDPGLRSDQGLRLRRVWASSELSVAVVNGEGLSQAERGPKKDLILHFRQTHQLSEADALLWSLAAMEGHADGVESEVSERQRLLAFVKWTRSESFALSAEFLRSKDPVDAINLTRWDGVDLTAQGGQIAHGTGGALEFEKYFGPEWSASLRLDHYNPDEGVDAKGLETKMLGFHYFPEPMLQISLSWVDVAYGEKHTVALRDANQTILTARVHW